jgi:hypothetical protein
MRSGKGDVIRRWGVLSGKDAIRQLRDDQAMRMGSRDGDVIIQWVCDQEVKTSSGGRNVIRR